MINNLEKIYSKSIKFHSSFINITVVHNKHAKKIYDFLTMQKDVNYFDTLSTYLILYIYPKLLSDNNRNKYSNYSISYIYSRILILIKKTIFISPFLIRRYTLFNINIFSKKNKTLDNLKDDKFNILFPIFTISHYYSVLSSVVDQLSRKENITINLLFKDLKTLEIFNHSKSRNLLSIDLYKPIFDDDRTNKIHYFLNRILSNESIFLDLCNEYNISYLKFKNTLMSVFCLELFKLNIYHQLYDSFKEVNKINLIVLSDHADQRLRLLVQLYKSINIKSIVIQQGITSKHYPEWNNLLNDFVMSNGKLSAKIIESQGVNKSSIFTTGHPGFDVFNTIKKISSTEKQYFGLFDNEKIENKKIILFASQPFYLNSFSSNNIRTLCIEAIKSIVISNKNLLLIIKPHPFEEIGFLKNTFQGNSSIKILPKESDINCYIKLCDIFVTMHSTTAFQAMSLNKPVITLDFDHTHEYSPFINSNSTYSARSRQDLEFFINCLTQSNNYNINNLKIIDYKKFLNDSFNNQDGKATERIITFIMSIININNSGLHISK